MSGRARSAGPLIPRCRSALHPARDCAPNAMRCVVRARGANAPRARTYTQGRAAMRRPALRVSVKPGGRALSRAASRRMSAEGSASWVSPRNFAAA